MLLKRPALCASLITLLALTGCGSGGSSSSSGPNDKPPVITPDNVQLSGVATKGLLKAAKVTAYELDDAGTRLPEAVGTGETDDSGAYEIELAEAYTGGVIEVEVSVVEGVTKMICDAAQCGSAQRGDEISLPADFTLSAIVEKASDANTVNASVTAWSTMAAKRAKALLEEDSTKSIADATRQAVSEVSQVVGFDIANTESLGLSQIEGATGAQAQYAVMNAVVAELLFQDSDGSDLTAKLNSFTSALDDGILGNAVDSVQLEQLSSFVREVVESVPELDGAASSALNNQTAQYDAAGDEGFAPEYDEDLAIGEDATEDDKVNAFKSFIAQGRTWISSAEALDADAIGLAVDVDVQTVETILSSDTQSQFAFVGLALDQVGSFLIDNAASIQGYIDNGVEQDISVLDDMGIAIGTASLTFADVNGLQVSIDGALTGEHGNTYLPFGLVLNTGVATDALNATAVEDEGGMYVALSVAKLLASNTMTLSGHVGDGQGTNPLTLNELSVNLELDQELVALEGEAILSEDINSHFKSATLVGNVTIANEGASFTGNVELQIVKLLSGFAILGEDVSPIAFKYFGVSGDFIMDGGSRSFSASAYLDVQNAANFDTFTWSDYSNGEDDVFAHIDNALVDTLDANLRTRDDYLFNVHGNLSEGATALTFTSDYWTGGQVEPHHTSRTVTEAEYDAIEAAVHAVILDKFGADSDLTDALTINWIDIGGNKWDGAWIWAEFSFPDLETAENFMQVALTLSAKVTIPDLETAQVTTTINRSSRHGGSLLANVKWNGGNYTMEVSSDDVATGQAANVRLFNAQGYELNLDLTFASEESGGDLTNLTGTALLNGEEVGAVEFREGAPVIVYSNEDFESLF